MEFAQKERNFKNEKREEKEEKGRLQFSFNFLLHLTFQFEMLYSCRKKAVILQYSDHANLKGQVTPG